MPEKKSKVMYLVGALAAALGITAVVVLVNMFSKGSSSDGERVPASTNDRTSHTTTAGKSPMGANKQSEPSNSSTVSNNLQGPESKANKQGQSGAKSSDDNKDLPKPPRKRITKDPTKPVEPTAQAKSTATQWFSDNKARFDPLFKDSKTLNEFTQSIQTANSFTDVAKIIIDEIKASGEDEDFIFGDPKLARELGRLFLEVLADYFDALNEDASVVEALILLADDYSTRKMSDYEYAANWGTVIMKVKNLDVLTSLYDTKEKKQSMAEVIYFIHIPYHLFVLGDISLLRNPAYTEKTAMLLRGAQRKL